MKNARFYLNLASLIVIIAGGIYLSHFNGEPKTTPISVDPDYHAKYASAFGDSSLVDFYLDVVSDTAAIGFIADADLKKIVVGVGDHYEETIAPNTIEWVMLQNPVTHVFFHTTRGITTLVYEDGHLAMNGKQVATYSPSGWSQP